MCEKKGRNLVMEEINEKMKSLRKKERNKEM